MAEISPAISTTLAEILAPAVRANEALAEPLERLVSQILDLEDQLEDAQYPGDPYDDGPGSLDLAQQLADRLRAYPQDTVRRVCDCLMSGSASDLWQVLGE